jgi:hypothetical protein
MKIAGSGSASESVSTSQRYGPADPDPDPYKNFMNPQHCKKHHIFSLTAMTEARDVQNRPQWRNPALPDRKMLSILDPGPDTESGSTEPINPEPTPDLQQVPGTRIYRTYRT